MNNEDYVSYELALKLKECGFDEPCDHYYTNGYANPDPNAEEERIWMFEKYEQALSAGIAAAIELIKKGE